MKKVVFVCTGNTCRSPMAEAVLSNLCKDCDVEVSSCGIFARDGDTLSDEAKGVLARNGIIFSHTAKRVSEEILGDADYIVGMTSTHAAELCIMFPHLSDKIYSFPTDVSDPFGADASVYDKCYLEIAEGVESVKKAILQNEN